MPSVVVVGGGLAGLTCAFRLRRAGHEVEVLERDARPGGRARSEARGDFLLEAGASRAARGDRNLHALASALGLEAELRPLPSAPCHAWQEGGTHPADPRHPLATLRGALLSPGGRARLARAALALWRRRRRLDPARPERAAALDRGDDARALAALLGDEGFELLLAPQLARELYCDPGRVSSAAALLLLRRLLAAARPESFAGGFGQLARAIADRVPVRLGCEALRVETETDGARVRYRSRGREHSVFADAAVVALPGCHVAHVCPKLTPEERGFFEAVRYGRALLVHLLVETAPAHPAGAILVPPGSGSEIAVIELEHRRPGAAPAGTGLLRVALAPGAAGRLWRAGDAALVERVAAAVARSPLGRPALVGSEVWRWEPAQPLFEPGALVRLRRFGARLDRAPRLAFAGDYLVGASLEGAVTSGMRAADEIARAV